MKRHLLVALAAVVALGLTASMAQAQCAFEHPRKAKGFACNMIQAFVSCGNPGGNAPNTTSASGLPSCQPPQTFNQAAGTPINGWQWWEERSTGKLLLREFAGSFGPGTRDMKLKLRLRRILDGTGGFASGAGTLSTVARVTLEDNVISGPGAGTDMTVIDFPAPFPFSMSNGNASLTSTVNTLIGGLGLSALPGCTAIEIIDVTVLDPNGSAFGHCGIFFKDTPNP